MTNNELKYYSSLNLKKNRKNEKKFIAEGKRLVKDGLKSSFICEKIIVSQQFLENNHDYFQESFIKEIESDIVSNKDFQKIAETKSPQGIVAIFNIPNSDFFLEYDSLIVGLENISDPGNLGTILRTCDWFGIKNVILSEECAEIYNSKVLRSSMGAIFHINILESKDFYTRLKELQLEGFNLLTADLEGKNVFEYIPNPKEIVIFCNEANGPTEKLKQLINKKITIPKIGEAESLNVASAAAVILSHLTK